MQTRLVGLGDFPARADGAASGRVSGLACSCVATGCAHLGAMAMLRVDGGQVETGGARGRPSFCSRRPRWLASPWTGRSSRAAHPSRLLRPPPYSHALTQTADTPHTCFTTGTQTRVPGRPRAPLSFDTLLCSHHRAHNDPTTLDCPYLLASLPSRSFGCLYWPTALLSPALTSTWWGIRR